jgi:hypothetical protein
MNNIFSIRSLALGFVLALAASNGRAQTSLQPLSLSLLAGYQANSYTTNTTTDTTNETARLPGILIATGNIVRAIAVDLDGPTSTNWNGANLVREVNLTNGNEGIFLRKNGLETNVSSFFGLTFSNNLTAGLLAGFPGLTNFPGVSNVSPANFELIHGSVVDFGATNATTNASRTSGLYSLSINTTNLKINLIGVGDGNLVEVSGQISGVPYKGKINTELVGCAGTFYLNLTTNIFDQGTNTLPFFVTGPLHGSLGLGQPRFAAIPGP